MLIALIISVIVNIILGIWLIVEKINNADNKQQLDWFIRFH